MALIEEAEICLGSIHDVFEGLWKAEAKVRSVFDDSDFEAAKKVSIILSSLCQDGFSDCKRLYPTLMAIIVLYPPSHS